MSRRVIGTDIEIRSNSYPDVHQEYEPYTLCETTSEFETRLSDLIDEVVEENNNSVHEALDNISMDLNACRDHRREMWNNCNKLAEKVMRCLITDSEAIRTILNAILTGVGSDYAMSYMFDALHKWVNTNRPDIWKGVENELYMESLYYFGYVGAIEYSHAHGFILHYWGSEPKMKYEIKSCREAVETFLNLVNQEAKRREVMMST